jgi:hypothetical protein
MIGMTVVWGALLVLVAVVHLPGILFDVAIICFPIFLILTAVHWIWGRLARRFPRIPPPR